MKLLLSLYACEPNRGSEPGVGWAWARGMSSRHHTYCLTRANNRDVIEQELFSEGYAQQNSQEKGVHLYQKGDSTLRFIFFDLPLWAQKLKKARVLSTTLYYALWQFKARGFFDSLNLDVDIIHHVTFCSFMIPGVWWQRKEKVVLGPLGGFSVCSNAFLRLYPLKERIKEALRGYTRKLWRLNPFFIKSLKSANLALFTDTSIYNKISSTRTAVVSDVAIPEKLISFSTPSEKNIKNQFTWAGTMGPHKALEIIIKAYHKAFSNNLASSPVLKVFGNGSNTPKMKELASSLGLEEKILFSKGIPQEQLWNEISSSIAFIFSSVRDTTGSVALEAMACGTPVICFDHQGVGTITTNDTAIKITPSTWDNAISDFASAMQKLYINQTLARELGNSAKKHAYKNHTWNKKFDFVDSLYKEII